MAHGSRATVNPSAASHRGTARMMARLPALALGALSSLALAASTAGARAEDALGGDRAGPVVLTAAQMDAVTIAPVVIVADAAPAGLSPTLLSEVLQQVDRLAADPFAAGAVGPCPNGRSGASTVCGYPDRGGLPLAVAVAVTDSEPLAERPRAETAPAVGPAVPAASSLAAAAPPRPPSRSPWTAAAAPPTEAVAAITADLSALAPRVARRSGSR